MIRGVGELNVCGDAKTIDAVDEGGSAHPRKIKIKSRVTTRMTMMWVDERHKAE